MTFRFDDVGDEEYCFTLSEDNTYMEDFTGVPHEYKDHTTADFSWNIYKQDMSFEKRFVETYIKKWELAKEGGDGMYIYSRTPGSGKTLLACCIGTEITRKYGARMRFLSVTKYLELCKNRGPEYEDAFNCDLLVLDDIGAEDESKAYVAEMVYNLVNRRYAGKLPTIYTSNKMTSDGGYEPRIASRLEINTMIAMPEKSIRSEMAQKHQAAFLKQLMG